MDRSLVNLLHDTGCSLVVKDGMGCVTTYNKKGVRDLDYLLAHEPQRLRGAVVADKVVGKAAAGFTAVAGVAEVYADVMSLPALCLLREAGVACHWAELVDRIEIPDGDSSCQLEIIVASADTPQLVVDILRTHFKDMGKHCVG